MGVLSNKRVSQHPVGWLRELWDQPCRFSPNLGIKSIPDRKIVKEIKFI